MRCASRRVRRWVGGLAVLTACGGGNTEPTPPPPPPPPPSNAVASVAVSPSALTPFPGDTATLTATPKTASGVVLSGKTITWASGNASSATVSTGGVVTAIAPGSATVTATVDGVIGTAQVTVSPPVALDVAHLVTKQVGQQGDSLTTTGGNGVTYTLVIPPNAVHAPLTITATPLLSVHGLPFTGGLLAGLELKPTGTVFDQPVVLRISGAHAIPAGQLLVGFTEPDLGGAVSLLPATLKNGIISILVPHFSINGAGMAIPLDLDALTPPVDLQSQTIDFDRMALIVAQHGDLTIPSVLIATLDQLTTLFNQWFNRILPILQGGKNDDTSALTALLEYRDWSSAMDYASAQLGLSSPLVSIPLLAGDVHLGQAALFLDLVPAVDRANQSCAANKDLGKLDDELFWLAEAEDIGISTFVQDPTLGPQLSRSQIMAHLCVSIVVTDSTFPSPPAVGQSNDLHLRFGNKFGNDPNLRNTTFSLHITFAGTAADGSIDVQTDFNGKFDTTVVPAGGVPMIITVHVCMLPADVGTATVCQTFLIQRGFGRTITGTVTISSDAGLAGLSDVAKINGSLFLTGTGITSTDLHQLSALTEITGDLVLQEAHSVQSFAGLTALKRVDGTIRLQNLQNVSNLPDLSTFPALQTMGAFNISCGSSDAWVLRFPTTLSETPTSAEINGCSHVTDLTLLGRLGNVHLLTLRNLSGLSSLASLQGLLVSTSLDIEGLHNLTTLAGVHAPQLASLNLADLPGVTSLAPLQVVVTTSLGIEGLPQITTLTGVRASPAMGEVSILNNTALQDLAALTGITTAGALSIAGNGLTSVGELATLTSVPGTLSISGNALSSLAGLGSLQNAGSVALDFDHMPALHSATFTALTATSLQLVVGQPGATCPGSAVTTVSFPSLTTMPGADIGGNSGTGPVGGCQIDLIFQNLTDIDSPNNLFASLIVRDGVRDLTFGQALTVGLLGGSLSVVSQTVKHVDFGGPITADVVTISGSRLASITGLGGTMKTQLSIGRSPSLLSIGFTSPIHTCELNIIDNPSLASVSGLSGSTTGCQVVITGNTSWSTAQIQAALSHMSIGGTTTVSGNKQP